MGRWSFPIPRLCPQRSTPTKARASSSAGRATSHVKPAMRTAPANIWDSAGSHCHVCDIRRVMLHLFKRTKKNVESLSKPSIGEERRAYAIGDIHGRMALFDHLLELISDDSSAEESRDGKEVVCTC